MTDHSIRNATLSDVSAVIACVRAAYADAAARLPDLPDVAGGLDADIQDNIVRVVTIGSRVAAMMVLVIHDEHVKLANIAVHPDFSGHGMARALMDDADRIALTLGRNEMRLVTHTGMPENIAMYTHLGWSVEKTTGSSVVMRKTI